MIRSCAVERPRRPVSPAPMERVPPGCATSTTRRCSAAGPQKGAPDARSPPAAEGANTTERRARRTHSSTCGKTVGRKPIPRNAPNGSRCSTRYSAPSTPMPIPRQAPSAQPTIQNDYFTELPVELQNRPDTELSRPLDVPTRRWKPTTTWHVSPLRKSCLIPRTGTFLPSSIDTRGSCSTPSGTSSRPARRHAKPCRTCRKPGPAPNGRRTTVLSPDGKATLPHSGFANSIDSRFD